MTIVNDFKVGDRVEHIGGMGFGTVEVVDSAVVVKFDNWKSSGKYDENWFRTRDLLRHITNLKDEDV